MTVVLLHGVPETPAIWDPLLAVLGHDDVITLALPGFGCPTPEGFGATQDEYAAWMLGEFERLVAVHGPLDVVGHDWGGFLAMRVASLRPDLVHTWVCDVMGVFHPNFRWHEFAQLWQTPDVGEQYIGIQLRSPLSERVGVLEAAGIPREIGTRIAAEWDETMGRCILALYRSAPVEELQRWAADLGHAAVIPGLVIIAPIDPFGSDHDETIEVVDRLGAARALLEHHGHWWMLHDPDAAAEMLRHFWAEAY